MEIVAVAMFSYICSTLPTKWDQTSHNEGNLYYHLYPSNTLVVIQLMKSYLIFRTWRGCYMRYKQHDRVIRKADILIFWSQHSSSTVFILQVSPPLVIKKRVRGYGFNQIRKKKKKRFFGNIIISKREEPSSRGFTLMWEVSWIVNAVTVILFLAGPPKTPRICWSKRH